MRVSWLAVIGLWLTSMVAACHGGPRGEHTSVLETVREPAAGAASTTPKPTLTDSPIVTANVRTAVAPFAVLARQSRVPKTPCAGCHTKPLTGMRWDGSDGHATAHWQVELAHAPKNVMNCSTCHTDSAPGTLRTLIGEPVVFDHAYEVCAQCHSKQRTDWEGGAHGKRAVGWASSRVVFNCTECHNPHRPALDSRWPARAGRTDR